MFNELKIGQKIRYYVSLHGFNVGDKREGLIVGKGSFEGEGYLVLLNERNGFEWKVFESDLVNPFDTSMMLGPLSVIG